ncbi:MAG: tRNA (guanine(10)-N(2))-dimethyltransferase [Methanobacteriota archaeon]
MQTIFVTEGETTIEVPNPENFRTHAGDYAPSLTRVFYNPSMEFCRDISVSVVQTISKTFNNIWACDPLAGVGIRGIRYAKEVNGVLRSFVNDRSEEAFKLIKRNVELNGLNDLVEAKSTDANIALWENLGRFNFVDLDPFGSPAPFVDAACGALSRKGMLALTATDTAPLSGTHARACLRRYGAKSLKTEYCHELGIRILLGFTQRIGGLHEMALTPVFAHATQHYFRIYMMTRRGAQRTDEVLKKIGFISHCDACMRRILTGGVAAELPKTCECGGLFSHAGPLWLGELINKQFTQEIIGDLAMRNFKLKHKEITLLSRCVGEAEGPPTFYDLNELSRRAGTPPPKLAELISMIRAQGYFSSRTHFSNTGFRTDAPVEEINKILKCV